MSKKDQNIPQPVLFDAEEMGRITPGDIWEDKNKPVTCLGMEFPNDDARREYFREELRKKLPELRQIEGFPIGKDEDIIKLSDPPYYTACPNPWLNDFIAQWEEEKKQLEREGKRKTDFEVKEPYAYGIKQGKNSAIYNAHSYHTKVPHEVIMRYILHYTQPGDIVLDGFAGTGMTGVAASACGNPDADAITEIESDFKDNGFDKPNWGQRRAICGDLSPLCFHISSNYNSSVNRLELQEAVNNIIGKLNDRFGHFYELPVKLGEKIKVKAHINYFVWSEVVACKNCGCEMNVHDLSFDYDTHTLHELLTCPRCGTKQKRTEADSIEETTFDEQINKVVKQLKYECCLLNYSIPKHGRGFTRNIPIPEFPQYEGFLPIVEFGEGDKFGDPKRVGANSVNQLYYPRTKWVLAYLYKLIHTDYKPLVKPLMFIFTSMLPKLTRMNRYMPQHGSRALVGPMANTLYIPPQGVENNPIDQFEYQAGKVIRALAQCNYGNAVQICSATNSSVPSNSIDYIFTDPPFGANIMYSELNTVSESWLSLMTNNQEEAISNNTQHKGLVEYQEIMTRSFKEYHRILKPGAWMTVEFSNTSASFWNSLQHSIKAAGFIISAITDLNKERGGLHAMLGPTAVKQDLAISCYKPNDDIKEKIKERPAESLWDLVAEHLSYVAKFIEKDGKSAYIIERDPRIIFDRIISYYVQNGFEIPIDSVKFRKELSEHFAEVDGMFFSPSDAAIYQEKKKETEGFAPMGIIVSDEANGIQWLKNFLRDGAKRYNEIQPEWMQAINSLRKNDILPELRQILEENFIKEEDGKWRLPNIQDDKDVNALRTKALLKEFKIYVDVAQKPKAKIKEARVEALRAGFKQCYVDKDFQTIVTVGNKIPQNLLIEDEVLLQFYDIAQSKL